MKHEQASLEDIECYFDREFSALRSTKRLNCGRISSVYKINRCGQDQVVKFSAGMYRVMELEREVEVLKYLKKAEYGYVVSSISKFMRLGKLAYLIEDYFDGKTVRERLGTNKSVKERLKIWEKVGHVLSEIHN